MTRSTQRRDDGAVLPIFAVFVLVAVVFLAFVVDLGNQRQDRRQLTTATDAAALDVAQKWSDNSLDPLPSFNLVSTNLYECDAEAQEYLARNRDVVPSEYECRAEFVNGQLASVEVFAGDETDYQIAPVFGSNSGAIGSRSAVRISSAPGGGLRPFGVCLSALSEWDEVEGSTVLVAATKFLPEECGQNNGNWGYLQYPTQPNGNTGVAEVLAEGANDPVKTIEPVNAAQAAIECNLTYGQQQAIHGGKVDCLFESTGTNAWNSSAALSAWNELVTSGTRINLPVYDHIQDLGGSGTGFPVVGFLEVQVLAYCGNPATPAAVAYEVANPCNGSNNNYLDLRIWSSTSGDCCDVNASNQHLQLCDVGTAGGARGSDFATNCQTSDATSGLFPPIPPPPPPCTVSAVTLTSGTDLGAVPVANNGDLQTTLSFDVEVNDATGCASLTARAAKQTNGGQNPSATVGGPTGNVYAVTFSPGTKFSKSAPYRLAISNAGVVVDQTVTFNTN